jgi:hypothetical protein
MELRKKIINQAGERKLIKICLPGVGMESKICQKCKILKPLEEFSKRKIERDGFQRWCKICNRAESKKWIKKYPDRERVHSQRWRKTHPEVERRYAKKKKIRNKLKWKEIIDTRKMNFCSICRYNKCFAAIHFHHKNGKEKIEGMSNYFHRAPTLQRIWELDKCVALCANCHAELHDRENKEKQAGELGGQSGQSLDGRG